MTRVAVVDLGTNSTRLLVAEVADGHLEEVERRLTITRLGEGVDGERSLGAAGIARVKDCLARYRRAIDELGAERLLAYATSAVRDAANGASFLGEVEAEFGLPTRLLSGEEEALLTFRGATFGRRLEGLTAVVDLGGGSTEIVLGDADGIRRSASIDVGCVRLAERFVRSDPPSGDEAESIRAHVRSFLLERFSRAELPASGIGAAGTVTTLATLHLGLPEEIPELVHGHRLPAAWIAEESRRLAESRVEELRERPGIVPERAGVIAAGALAVAEIVEFFQLDELEVSEWDILHGAALETAA